MKFFKMFLLLHFNLRVKNLRGIIQSILFKSDEMRYLKKMSFSNYLKSYRFFK